MSTPRARQNNREGERAEGVMPGRRYAAKNDTHSLMLKIDLDHESRERRGRAYHAES